MLTGILQFLGGCARLVRRGNRAYYAWLAVLGVAIVVGLVAIISLPRARFWKEAIIIAAGAWLFLSPWLLGFAGSPNARWNAWMLGALLIYAASWAFTDLMRLSHPPRR